LIIEDETHKILIVTDLHIGWEVPLVKKGIHIPSQSSKLTENILKLIREHNPDRLYLLGDIKQAVSKISWGEWKDVPDFFESIEKEVSDITVTLGNHDGDLKALTPSSVTIHPSSGSVIDMDSRIGLFHGHAWPSPKVLSSDVILMGHIHPVIRFRDSLGLWTVRQVWLRATCDGEKLVRAYVNSRKLKMEGNVIEAFEEKFGVKVRNPRLIIMPAFNDLIGGLSVNRVEKRLMGVLLRSGAITLDDCEAYLLDGTFIGAIGHLRQLLNS
jgi:putative SbcD/Mre11-related phosphoesterase